MRTRLRCGNIRGQYPLEWAIVVAAVAIAAILMKNYVYNAYRSIVGGGHASTNNQVQSTTG